MVKKPGASPQAIRSRAAKTAAAMAGGAPQAQAEPPKKRVGFAQFAKEVRSEARKITWTTRKETWITSVMVGIMVVLAAIFFFTIDVGLGFVVSKILEFANAGL